MNCLLAALCKLQMPLFSVLNSKLVDKLHLSGKSLVTWFGFIVKITEFYHYINFELDQLKHAEEDSYF